MEIRTRSPPAPEANSEAKRSIDAEQSGQTDETQRSGYMSDCIWNRLHQMRFWIKVIKVKVAFCTTFWDLIYSQPKTRLNTAVDLLAEGSLIILLIQPCQGQPKTNEEYHRFTVKHPFTGDGSFPFNSIRVPTKPTRWWVVEAAAHHIYYSEKHVWAAVSRLIRQRSHRDRWYDDWCALTLTCYLRGSRQQLGKI